MVKNRDKSFFELKAIHYKLYIFPNICKKYLTLHQLQEAGQPLFTGSFYLK